MTRQEGNTKTHGERDIMTHGGDMTHGEGKLGHMEKETCKKIKCVKIMTHGEGDMYNTWRRNVTHAGDMYDKWRRKH